MFVPHFIAVAGGNGISELFWQICMVGMKTRAVQAGDGSGFHGFAKFFHAAIMICQESCCSISARSTMGQYLVHTEPIKPCNLLLGTEIGPFQAKI